MASSAFKDFLQVKDGDVMVHLTGDFKVRSLLNGWSHGIAEKDVFSVSSTIAFLPK